MTFDSLLFARDDCIATCPDPAGCSCSDNESCVLTVRSCNACPENQCIANAPPSSGSSSSGVSKGAVVGAVIAVLLFIAAAVVFVWWYRRRAARRRAAEPEVPKEVPARAEDVLNRPDPNEKPDEPTRVQSSATSINPNQIFGQAIGTPTPSHRGSTQSNPFSDVQSIQTTSTSTHGTNVIPIALIPPPNGSSISGGSPLPSSSNINPARPERTPDMDLNLDIPRNNAGASKAASNPNRSSYLSSMSYASDFLNEVPMIVTPTRGTVRQVFNVAKGAVVQSPSSPGSSDAGSVNKATRSPLAGTSFGPEDVVREVDEEEQSGKRDPFSDAHAGDDSGPQTPVSPSKASMVSDFSARAPGAPWARSGAHTRPTSVNTQASSIIAEVSNATRVNIGLKSAPQTANSFRSQNRMTSAKLVAPNGNTNNAGPLERQQRDALAATRQDANRISGGSVLTNASANADSILESFPFVPPSPISNLPPRSPPRSPSATGQETSGQPTNSQPSSPLPPPPDRKTLGMSTGSQISTMSAGLGAFPFQIDSTPRDSNAAAPTSVNGRVRASLDTLALTSDLSSYPLGFDKELQDNYPLRK